MGNIKAFHENYSAKLKPFPYQFQTFQTIKDLKYAAIFHEQGLGKTKIAIDILLYWLEKRDIDTVLIVTKKQLIQNWLMELNFHTYIQPKVLTNKKSDNFYVFNSRAKIVITNFEIVMAEEERVKLYLKSRNVGIIIDESTKLKNPSAKLTQTFFELSSLFKLRIIMTGTPVANRPYDIWSQIYFLDHGKHLGNNFNEFKRDTDLSNQLANDVAAKTKFEHSIENIYDKISTFTVRETKNSSGIILPEKVYKNVFVDFEPKQLNMYQQVIEMMEIEIKKQGRTYIDDDTENLKRLLRLLEITSNPMLLDDSYTMMSGKEQTLKKIIENIVSQNEKCIVWSNFIENINLFCRKYNMYNARKVHGGMTIDERNKSIDIFKNDDKCKVLFATPQSAKEGLTLTVANHVIFYDRGFNLDDYLQAQDRIHRISQKKKCFVYNLIIKNSIDEWIDKLLEAKQQAAFLVQGDINLSKYRTTIDYSYGDLVKKILGAD